MLCLVGLACAFAFAQAAPVGGVDAFRAADGEPDPSFVHVGGASSLSASVRDRSGGAFLAGQLTVPGGRVLPVVHLRAGGEVDAGFHVKVAGGRVLGVALAGDRLVLVGSFTSVNGAPRWHVGLVDASSGRTLRWAPALPPGASASATAVVAGSTLVVGAGRSIVAWRDGRAQPLWVRTSVFPGVGARGWRWPLALWHGSLWSAADDPVLHIFRLDLKTGTGFSENVRSARGGQLQVIAGAMTALDGFGGYVTWSRPGVPFEEGGCGQGQELAVTSVTGDAAALYSAVEPFDTGKTPSFSPISACPAASSGRSAWQAKPTTASGFSAIALVGRDVLAFTRPFTWAG